MYSIEEVYKYTGQYDKVASVSFSLGSESQRTFGNYIIGVFKYSKSERESLEVKMRSSPDEKTYGYIKFSVSKSFTLAEELRHKLESEGLLSSDIIEILQYNSPLINEFTKKELRSLPEKISLKADLDSFDEEELFLYLINGYLTSGYNLTPFERDRYNGILIRKFAGQITHEFLEEFYKPGTSELVDEVRYYYLKSKFLKDDLTPMEDADLKELYSKKIQDRFDKLFRELERGTKNIKDLNKNPEYKKILSVLYYITIGFKPERLSGFKYPIWWDFERFIHIYLRHVDALQIGERFEVKTAFQYQTVDIQLTIVKVLDLIQNDIESHFSTTPNSDFYRIGEMGVYYKGDYYSLHIEKTGRLLTVFKQSTRTD